MLFRSAIELFNASQALEFRRPLKSSPFIENLIAQYRQKVAFIQADKVMYPELAASVKFLRNFELILPVEGAFKYEFPSDLKALKY